MARPKKRFFHFAVGRAPRHWYSLVLVIGSIVVFTAGFLIVGRIKGVDIARLLDGLTISFARVAAAYALSLVLGMIFAFLVTRSETTENTLLPVFETLQSLPTPAIFPLLSVTLGRGNLVVIILLVIAMIWPIVFGTIGGIKGIRPSLAEASTIFGARGWKRLVFFTLPVVMPAVITGSIVAWGEGWDILMAAELLGAQRGIGAYIGETADAGALTVMTIAIVFLMFILFLINKWVWATLLKKVTLHHDV